MKKSLKQMLTAASVALLGFGLVPSITSVQAQDNKIIVYTNSLDDTKREWLDAKVAEAGFNVEYVIAGGGETFDRLMAEKNDVQADVVIGMDEGSFAQLHAENLLAPWDPSWKGDLVPELVKGDGYYYPWAEQRIFAFYDANQLSADQVPTSLDEIGTTAELAGKYLVPNDFGRSTNQKLIMSILLNHLDEAGEYGVSEEGWQAVADFIANAHILGESEEKFALIADQVTPISFHFSGGIPAGEEEFGFKAVPINPEGGVFTMAEQVGIMNKGEDHDYTNAKAFAEWWGSEEVQRGWVETFGSVPANQKVQDAVNPRVLELLDQTDRMDVNWDVINQHLADWVEKIELELMPF
ncbi:TPA: extracellular solute-binding protein [Streptococcus suis]